MGDPLIFNNGMWQSDSQVFNPFPSFSLDYVTTQRSMDGNPLDSIELSNINRNDDNDLFTTEESLDSSVLNTPNINNSPKGSITSSSSSSDDTVFSTIANFNPYNYEEEENNSNDAFVQFKDFINNTPSSFSSASIGEAPLLTTTAATTTFSPSELILNSSKNSKRANSTNVYLEGAHKKHNRQSKKRSQSTCADSKKVSDSRLSAQGLAKVLNLSSPEEALKRERFILNIFEHDLNYPLGYKTWIRDTTKEYRTKLIEELYQRVQKTYPEYNHSVLETIIRRATYYMMQSRLRRERRAKTKDKIKVKSEVTL